MAKVDEEKLAYTNDLPGASPNNPVYFENEVIDHLLGIVLELGAQHWVLRERRAFLEEQLAANGSLSIEELDQGRPSEALQKRLDEERQDMIYKVYGRLYKSIGGDKAKAAAAIMG